MEVWDTTVAAVCGRFTPRPFFVLALGLLSASCADRPPSDEASVAPRDGSISAVEARHLDPPAEPGALAPNLATVDGALAATWLEPLLRSGAAEHRLRFSMFRGGAWSDPVSIAEGPDFFANWADLPSLVEAGDGRLYASWLAKTADDTYAYSIFLARSVDQGASWEALGQLNSDATPTEHGFVSLIPEATGARAFWLDGRRMIEKQPMTLLTAAIGLDPAAEIGPEELLDNRVCECCSTGAVLAAEGPAVVYRDRGEAEVRDIGIVRRIGSGWSSPAMVAEDFWTIAGCPVNGPAIDAAGSKVVVAWFTSPEDTRRLQVAFSDDSAASFRAPLVVATDSVLGRADVASDGDGGAWVSWVAEASTGAEIRLQRFSEVGPLEASRLVAETSPSRASGFPILERVDGRLYIAFVEVGEDPGASRLRIRSL